MKVASASVKFDAWMWWPATCTVAAMALFVVLDELPGPLNPLLLVLTVVAFPVAALLLIGSASMLAWQRQHRRVASALMALAAPVLLLIPMVFIGPYVHLALMLTCGIGTLSPQTGPQLLEGGRLAIYDWTTGMVGGPNTFLIHDATDTIALPLTKDAPAAWRDNDLFRECIGRVRHLIGHYYICTD
jgi:hypothetical protein